MLTNPTFIHTFLDSHNDDNEQTNIDEEQDFLSNLPTTPEGWMRLFQQVEEIQKAEDSTPHLKPPR